MQTALHKAMWWGNSFAIKELIEAGADVNGQDNNGTTPLMEAAEWGRDHVVHELIRVGASVTAKNNKQQTALHKAISSSWGNRFSVVKALIEAGADVNEQDEDGTTPLMEAAEWGRDHVMHGLIRGGASVTAKNKKQQTALQKARNIWGNRFSVVKALNEAGADVNEQDEDGTTPLIKAANMGNEQVVHELIRAGASVTAKNKKQQTALHKASNSWGNRFSEVKALIEAGADVNEQDEDGTTPLIKAAEWGHDQIVHELIRAGACVTAKNKKLQTALHLAISSRSWRAHRKGHSSVVKALIESGADVNEQDEDGTSPLMHAANMGNEQVVHELIKAGASLTAMNEQQMQRALRYVSREGHSSVVRTLTEAGADVNGQDNNGTTPLMKAANWGHDQVVHELIKAGASVTAKNNKQQTALHIAISSSWGCHFSVVKALIEAGADVNEQDKGGTTPLMEAANMGNEQVVHELIKAGASVTAKNNKQQTALHLAISSSWGNRFSVVKALIEAGADVNEQDEDGTTPLIKAANMGNEQVVHELIRAGASVTAKNKKQQTALHLAISSSWGNRFSVVKALIEAGADVNEQDEDGTTPLIKAANMGNEQVVHELIRAGASVTAKNKKHQTALHKASNSWGNRFSEVKALIEAGADVNEQDEDRTTPLMHAAYMGSEQVVHELIKAGASVTAMDEQQMQRALRYASREGHSSVVRTLTEAGADVNGQNNNGTTLLMKAANWGHDQVVHELIKAGASVTAKNNKQQTALHIAISSHQGCHFSVVKALIEAGADVNEQDKGGTTPLMEAANMGNEQVVHELIRAGASVTAMNMQQKQRALCYASWKDHSSVIKMLIEAGADVNEHDEAGITLLMDAALKGQDQVVHMLIRAGASVTAVSRYYFGLVAAGSTALHFAADTNNIPCGVLLVEAGADMTARNNDSKSLLGLASVDFRHSAQRAQHFSTKRIVAVIGNAEHGKSTLIAALKAEGKTRFRRFTNRFAKVQNISQRTTGIEAVQFSSKKYGDTLFYDFAGQSDYHGPHHSFLEAMLSKPGVSVTLLLLVKATDEAGIITQQITRWLQPLALVEAPSTPQVILVGSFLDQVQSREEATEKLLQCTRSAQKVLSSGVNIRGPCLLDCRKPESEGINQICILFVETRPLLMNSNAFSYNLHWVLVQVRKALSVPAITLHTFQSWLLENAELLPLCLPPPEEVCRDLTAVGHTLFLPNKRYPSQSWLILDLQTILHDVYGTLFSSSKGKVNKFGLLHCSQLAELFPELDQAMIQEVLISLEFCIQVDPLLIREELLKLTATDKVEGWLYFPALVSAQPSEAFPGDPDPQRLQWACWQLRTVEKHFISAHLLQTIILRLAANHVFAHELAPSVREHCCSVWVSGLSWRSTKGVDIAVKISDSSVVQVVGRSKAGPEELHQYTSTVVQTVIQTTTQQTPKLEATSYIVHPYEPETWDDPKAPPPYSLYPVPSIVSCIKDRQDYVLSLSRQDGRLPHQMSFPELFGGWFPTLSVVEGMNFKREPQRGE